jgi:hypothetical protein
MVKSGEKPKFSLTVSNNEIRLTVGNCQAKPGPRGKITGMSRRSASALMAFLNACIYKRATFVTLTYRENVQDVERAYSDLRKMHKRMVYEFGGFCCVWKAELQKRGAVHYHLFALDAPSSVSRGTWVSMWLAVTDGLGDTYRRRFGVDVKDVDDLTADDAGVLVCYLAKYSAKEGAVHGHRNWGILGRGYAQEKTVMADVSEKNASAIQGGLLFRGGSVAPIAGGGYVVRYYAGNIGSADGFERMRDFVSSLLPADNAVKYLSIGTQLDFDGLILSL